MHAAESEAVARDADVGVHYEESRRFLRRPARVTSIATEGRSGSVVVAFTGDPAVVERRQTYRVSTIGLDLFATVDGEERCEVLDLSATGLAVAVGRSLAPDSRVPVVLFFEGAPHPGSVLVRSSVPIRGGRFRIGAICTGEGHGEVLLSEALTRASVTLQRLALQRLSGLR
jgi:hypothetical protein